MTLVEAQISYQFIVVTPGSCSGVNELLLYLQVESTRGMLCMKMFILQPGCQQENSFCRPYPSQCSGVAMEVSPWLRRLGTTSSHAPTACPIPRGEGGPGPGAGQAEEAEEEGGWTEA